MAVKPTMRLDWGKGQAWLAPAKATEPISTPASSAASRRAVSESDSPGSLKSHARPVMMVMVLMRMIYPKPATQVQTPFRDMGRRTRRRRSCLASVIRTMATGDVWN